MYRITLAPQHPHNRLSRDHFGSFLPESLGHRAPEIPYHSFPGHVAMFKVHMELSLLRVIRVGNHQLMRSFVFGSNHPIKQGIGIPGGEDRSPTDSKQRKGHKLSAVDAEDNHPARPLLLDVFSNTPTFGVAEERTVFSFHLRHYRH